MVFKTNLYLKVESKFNETAKNYFVVPETSVKDIFYPNAKNNWKEFGVLFFAAGIKIIKTCLFANKIQQRNMVIL